MQPSDTSAFPVLSLAIYYIRAIEDKHWLEAIVLAHMYIETQLRTIFGKDIRKTKSAKDNERVIKLVEIAKDKNKINDNLFTKLTEFNTMRNNAVHHLSIGIITYDELEPTARKAGSLIDELRALHAYKAFEPEKT